MKHIFLITHVPRISWSSASPSSFRPPLKTLAFLLLGLIVFGVGEASLVAAGQGVSPWTVLAQGISAQLQIGIGWATFWVSVAVLIFWIPLRQMPGLGTLLNVIVISATLELSLLFLPHPQQIFLQLGQVVIGVVLVGIGSGFYLIAHLGPGPRDGLMTGLQRVTGFPIAMVRSSLEISAVTAGWLLGGQVGIGTLVFALGIGPAVSFGLFIVARFTGAVVLSSNNMQAQ